VIIKLIYVYVSEKTEFVELGAQKHICGYMFEMKFLRNEWK